MHPIGTRRLRALAGLLCALAATLAHAATPAWPTKPVRLIVPYAAGGPNDVMARVLAQQLTTLSGQPFIVENKGGAGGAIGTDAVAKASPDGYTLGFVSAPFTMLPALQAKLPYDTLRDLAAVSKVAESPMVLMVPASSQFKTGKELLDYAKAHPEKLTYGTGGIGSTPHLTTELLAANAGIKLVHVPYKGGGESIRGLMGGEIDVLIDSITSTSGPIQSGKVRALAIASDKRSPLLPNVLTFQEAGLPQLQTTHWVGVVAPIKVSPDVLATLHDLVVRALKAPAVIQRLQELGATPVGDTSAAFQAFVGDEVSKWQRTVKAANIQVQ